MKLSLEWTLENRPVPLQVRVSAEVRMRRYPRLADHTEVEELSAVDTEGRPVALTPGEEREAETALLSEADSVEWCEECGRERAVSLRLCDECWLPKRRRA